MVRVFRDGVGCQFRTQRDQPRIAARIDLMLEPFEQMRAPLAAIDDMRSQPLGMQRDAFDLAGSWLADLPDGIPS